MPPKSSQSVYALADQLGVSVSTVSRVLNQRGGIGAETRRRVLAGARAAGLRPRSGSRQLTVAVVIDRHRFSSTGGFVAGVLTSLVEALSQQSVAVELITEHNLDRLNDQLADGVLALSWDDATIELMHKLRGVPVVMLNRMDVPGFSSVVTNHRRQGEMAVEYLTARGHERIAMVVEERDNWGTRQRIEGFIARMKSLGLEVGDSTIAYTDHQPMYGLLRRLTSNVRPTAIFIANESLGLEASYILQNVLRMDIPRDVSLLGMESSDVSQFVCPPLTTLCQPLEELARRSLEVLLRRLNDPAGEPVQVVLENRLIERESVATLRNKPIAMESNPAVADNVVSSEETQQ